MDAAGRATTVALLRGSPIEGGVQDRDGELTRYRPPGADRAFVFLFRDGPIESEADVAWIDDKGRVRLLPDNYGYGVVTPLAYRAPGVEEFERSLAVAEQDAREIQRIATLAPGPERALAASRLLAAERPENDWYVYFGDSLASRLLGMPMRWRSDDDGGEHTYREEVCLALFAARMRWSREERATLRAAALPSGDARREHLRLLVESGVEPEDADLFETSHAGGSSPRERALAARGLWLADAERGQRVVLSELVLERAEVARRLLPLLPEPEGESRDRFLDAVDRLADALVAAGPSA